MIDTFFLAKVQKVTADINQALRRDMAKFIWMMFFEDMVRTAPALQEPLINIVLDWIQSESNRYLTAKECHCAVHFLSLPSYPLPNLPAADDRSAKWRSVWDDAIMTQCDKNGDGFIFLVLGGLIPTIQSILHSHQYSNFS